MNEERAQRHAVLIANPQAGRGGRARASEVSRFCQILQVRGIKVEVLQTQGPHDAQHLAARAATEGGIREVIISGGDGTINEALQGVVGTRARLAIWATGTANVLARELRLPFDAAGAAEVFARGRVLRVAIGCATSELTSARRYFFLMAGIGLDASVVRNVNLALKRRIGELAYWYSGLAHLTRWPPPQFALEIEGERIPATLAIIGKAAGYGGGLKLTPRARLSEPEFEICVVDSQSRFRYLYLLSHAMRGGAPANTGRVRFFRATRVRATGDAFVQTDGELIGQLPMTFAIVAEPIEIIVP